jgi:hypothetical protein
VLGNQQAIVDFNQPQAGCAVAARAQSCESDDPMKIAVSRDLSLQAKVNYGVRGKLDLGRPGEQRATMDDEQLETDKTQ